MQTSSRHDADRQRDASERRCGQLGFAADSVAADAVDKDDKAASLVLSFFEVGSKLKEF